MLENIRFELGELLDGCSEIMPRTAAGAAIGFFAGIPLGASGSGIFVTIIFGALVGAASHLPENNGS